MVKEQSETGPAIVLDTNVFVAAGFRPGSASARILESVRTGRLRLVWSPATRDETRAVLRRIPHLAWEEVAPLFDEANRHEQAVLPDHLRAIADPADRKFAAVAEAAAATLISSDHHLLDERHRVACEILTPSEFWGQWRGAPPGKRTLGTDET